MNRVFIKLLTTFLVVGIMVFISFSAKGLQIGDSVLKNPIVIYAVFIAVALCVPYGLKYLKKRKKEKYVTKVDTTNVAQDFDSLYSTLYSQCIGELEVLRKKVRTRQIIQYILYFALLVGYIFSKTKFVIIDKQTDEIIAITGMMLGVIGIVLTYFNVKYTKNYKQTYKQKIISGFIKLVDEKLVLVDNVDEKLASDEYSFADFDRQSYNRFSANDQIYGNIQGNDLKVWDLDIKMITVSGKSKEVQDIFQGVFASINCSNNLQGVVKISKNKQFKDLNKINLDSESFEKYFDVYSTNQILALRILTHDIMEMLVAFYNRYNLDFEIVFNNDKIYIRFATVDMFEPRVFGKSIKKELLYTEYVILKFILELIKKVNEVQLNIE